VYVTSSVSNKLSSWWSGMGQVVHQHCTHVLTALFQTDAAVSHNRVDTAERAPLSVMKLLVPLLRLLTVLRILGGFLLC
jgi:hypothetical protein